MIRQVHFGISNYCNMKCSHCFVTNKKPVKINIERLKHFLILLEKQGLTHAYYTYGEPLINEEIFEIANLLKSIDVYQVLMTNGTLIDDNMASIIKDHGINKVMVSIDSMDEKEHDLNRNYQGAFKKAMKAIDCLKNKNINVGIATTYMNLNKMNLKPFIHLLKNGEINCLSILAERNTGVICTNLSEDYVELFKYAVIENLDVIFHDFRLLTILKDMLNKSEITESIYNKFYSMNTCFIDENLSVAPNGEIYKCNFINKNSIANLNTAKSLDELVNLVKKYKVKGCGTSG